jgi:5-methylcytosine-specific restriction protein A
MALNPCTVCGTLTRAGSRCPAHARNGSTRQWRRTRARVLAQQPMCVHSGRPAEHVDHITPMSRGGTDHPANLQALCAACNLAKGDQ